MLRDHPVIERMERTGYANAIAQPEHCGTDFFDSEILEGDTVVEYEGETVLLDNLMDRENLQEFLAHLGFEFKTAV